MKLFNILLFISGACEYCDAVCEEKIKLETENLELNERGDQETLKVVKLEEALKLTFDEFVFQCERQNISPIGSRCYDIARRALEKE